MILAYLTFLISVISVLLRGPSGRVSIVILRPSGKLHRIIGKHGIVIEKA
jgi:hypothetical protein